MVNSVTKAEGLGSVSLRTPKEQKRRKIRDRFTQTGRGRSQPVAIAAGLAEERQLEGKETRRAGNTAVPRKSAPGKEERSQGTPLGIENLSYSLGIRGGHGEWVAAQPK